MSQPYLKIDSPEGSRELPLADKPITVGRHSSNMIVLSDGMASRYHCVVETGAEGLRIRDLDSSNGTRVNGQVIKTWRLGEGHVITIGHSSLTVNVPEPAFAPKPVAASVHADEDEDFEVEV